MLPENFSCAVLALLISQHFRNHTNWMNKFWLPMASVLSVVVKVETLQAAVAYFSIEVSLQESALT